MTAPRLRESLRLDAHHGPASRISRIRAEELIERAMERADLHEVPLHPVRPARRLRASTWITLALALSSAAVAGGAFYVAKRHGAPARFWTEVPIATLLAHGEGTSAGLSAGELLARADEVRAHGQWLSATALYEKVAAAAPDSDEAYHANLSAGLLRLNHLGDASGALQRLSSAIALRPNGMLNEQAHWARIESLRAMDDRTAEEKSLGEFLQLYPDGPLTQLARQRLGAFSEPSVP